MLTPLQNPKLPSTLFYLLTVFAHYLLTFNKVMQNLRVFKTLSNWCKIKLIKAAFFQIKNHKFTHFLLYIGCETPLKIIHLIFNWTNPTLLAKYYENPLYHNLSNWCHTKNLVCRINDLWNDIFYQIHNPSNYRFVEWYFLKNSWFFLHLKYLPQFKS